MTVVACFSQNASLLALVQEALRAKGISCVFHSNETAVMMRAFRQVAFDLVLVDVTHDVRAEHRIRSWLLCRSGGQTPVVLLCAHPSPRSMADALDAGADDCLATPFDPAELAARVGALLRRTKAHIQRTRRIELDGYVLERESGQCSDRGCNIELTQREFAIAWLFFSNPGVYLSRETISAAIWGVSEDIASRTIEQHVYKIRKKLRLATERGVRLRTAYARGYRLEVCGETDALAPTVLELDAHRAALARTAGACAGPVH